MISSLPKATFKRQSKHFSGKNILKIENLNTEISFTIVHSVIWSKTKKTLIILVRSCENGTTTKKKLKMWMLTFQTIECLKILIQFGPNISDVLNSLVDNSVRTTSQEADNVWCFCTQFRFKKKWSLKESEDHSWRKDLGNGERCQRAVWRQILGDGQGL